MMDLISGGGAECEGAESQPPVLPKATQKESRAPSLPKHAPERQIASDRDQFSGSSMAGILGSADSDLPSKSVCSTAPVCEPGPRAAKSAQAGPDEFVQANLFRSVQEGNLKLVKIAVENDGADINGK